jgi:hypothetical protein
MPIELVEINPTTLHLIFQGQWRWEELYDRSKEMQQALDAANHKLHILVDARASGKMPEGALTHLRKLSRDDHDNLGLVIIVGADTFMQAIASVIGAIYPNFRRYRFVSTMEEAQEILAAQRQKQDDS